MLATYSLASAVLNPNSTPDTHGVIAGRRNQARAVRRERDRMDVVAVPSQHCHLLPGWHVTEPDRVVGASRGQARAVRVERHRENRTAVRQFRQLYMSVG